MTCDGCREARRVMMVTPLSVAEGSDSRMSINTIIVHESVEARSNPLSHSINNVALFCHSRSNGSTTQIPNRGIGSPRHGGVRRRHITGPPPQAGPRRPVPRSATHLQLPGRRRGPGPLRPHLRRCQPRVSGPPPPPRGPRGAVPRQQPLSECGGQPHLLRRLRRPLRPLPPIPPGTPRRLRREYHDYLPRNAAIHPSLSLPPSPIRPPRPPLVFHSPSLGNPPQRLNSSPKPHVDDDTALCDGHLHNHKLKNATLDTALCDDHLHNHKLKNATLNAALSTTPSRPLSSPSSPRAGELPRHCGCHFGGEGRRRR